MKTTPGVRGLLLAACGSLRVASGDGSDLDLGITLAVAGLLLPGLLGLEVLDVELVAQDDGLEDFGGDLGAGDVGLAELGGAVGLADNQDLVEDQGLAGLGVALIDEVDEDGLALSDLALAAGLFDDGVHGGLRKWEGIVAGRGGGSKGKRRATKGPRHNGVGRGGMGGGGARERGGEGGGGGGGVKGEGGGPRRHRGKTG